MTKFNIQHHTDLSDRVFVTVDDRFSSPTHPHRGRPRASMFIRSPTARSGTILATASRWTKRKSASWNGRSAMTDAAARSRVDSCCLSRKMLNNPPIMTRRRTPRRFTRTDPCPICGGHDGLGRGQGVRCFGFFDDSGNYARCTREERAGSLSRRTATAPTATGCTVVAAAARPTAMRTRLVARRRVPAARQVRAAVPLVFHARGLPPPPLRRRHDRPALDLPRRRRGGSLPRPAR